MPLITLLLLLNLCYLLASALAYDVTEDKAPTCLQHRVIRRISSLFPTEEEYADA